MNLYRFFVCAKKFAIILLPVFNIAACASLAPYLSISSVYDKSVPESERCLLTAPPSKITITQFDDTKVSWKNGREIAIPAGEHTLTLFYRDLQYLSSNQGMEYTNTQTITYKFLPRRNYSVESRVQEFYNSQTIEYLIASSGKSDPAERLPDEVELAFVRKGLAFSGGKITIVGKDDMYVVKIGAEPGSRARIFLPKDEYSLYAKLDTSPAGKPLKLNAQQDSRIAVNTTSAYAPPRLTLAPQE